VVKSVVDSARALPTVLVCDDEQVLRSLVRAALQGICAVVEAADGDEAIQLAAEVNPTLMIVDMMMPGRSGLDVVRWLRVHERLATVPVIMLTAKAQAADQQAAMTAGVDLFVPKPFSPAVLAAGVKELFARGRRPD
jgi:DNA-binding response OmpR family regulator